MTKLPTDPAGLETFVKEVAPASARSRVSSAQEHDVLLARAGFWDVLRTVTLEATSLLFAGGTHGAWEDCVQAVSCWVESVFPPQTRAYVADNFARAARGYGNIDSFMLACVVRHFGELAADGPSGTAKAGG